MGVLVYRSQRHTAGANADGSQVEGAEVEATLATVRRLWGLPDQSAVVAAMTKRRVESKRGSIYSVTRRPRDPAT
eukprot:7086665-Prymnesium_polylepis.1